MPSPTRGSTDQSEPAAGATESSLTHVRRELIAARVSILELNDAIQERETARADAVTLLGRAELVLEEKINYIVELDRALSARIRELESECDRKTTEIDRRGTALAEAHRSGETQRLERDRVIADLAARLETANQQLGAAHELAGKYAAAENQSKTELAVESQRHAETSKTLATMGMTLEERGEQLRTCEQALAASEQDGDRKAAAIADLGNQLTAARAWRARVEASSFWKLGSPWRALFGPKS